MATGNNTWYHDDEEFIHGFPLIEEESYPDESEDEQEFGFDLDDDDDDNQDNLEKIIEEAKSSEIDLDMNEDEDGKIDDLLEECLNPPKQKSN